MKVFEGNYRKRSEKLEALADHICEHPECEATAPHRAPRAPDDLRTYRWFCLNHVREYNRAWNFFAGWTRRDIEDFQRDDITGHRPTWPVYGKRQLNEEMDDLENMFHTFSREWFDEERKNGGRNDGSKKRSKAAMDIKRACKTLDLKPGFDKTTLRSRYMELAKKYHPDMNGGCKKSEELLKSINQAYTYLLSQVS